jgi:glycine hydroxymethyltransferase
MDNARVMAKVLHERGCRVVSGRTECHMFLIDLRDKELTGRDAEAALGRVGITVHKNAVPSDPQKPTVTSGIRIGSPAMTTRGFKESEAELLATLIADVLETPQDEKTIKRVAAEVKTLCEKFPVYGR